MGCSKSLYDRKTFSKSRYDPKEISFALCDFNPAGLLFWKDITDASLCCEGRLVHIALQLSIAAKYVFTFPLGIATFWLAKNILYESKFICFSLIFSWILLYHPIKPRPTTANRLVLLLTENNKYFMVDEVSLLVKTDVTNDVSKQNKKNNNDGNYKTEIIFNLSQCTVNFLKGTPWQCNISVLSNLFSSHCQPGCIHFLSNAFSSLCCRF